VFGQDKKELTLNDLIIKEGKEAKIFKESNGAGEPTPPKPGEQANPTAKTGRERHLAQMQKTIEAQKTKAGL
jgi:hypothetical protein